jgi:chaperone LolA
MAGGTGFHARDIVLAVAIVIANGRAASAPARSPEPARPAEPARSAAPVRPSATAAGDAAAEAPAAAAPKASPEAIAALRKAIAFHREAKDLSLKFTASVYNAALDKRDEYQGRLLLKGEDKFRLEIPGGTYVSDGKTYWEYHPQTHQALRRDAAGREGDVAPGAVLLRFLDSDPLSAATVREDGKEWIELRLDPSRALKNLDSLAVLLDKETFALHRVSSRDVSGDEARYTVVSIRRNAGVKDGEFAFVPPKGAEVVDMRGE